MIESDRAGLRLSFDGPIGRIGPPRPGTHNALSRAVLEHLASAAAAATGPDPVMRWGR